MAIQIKSVESMRVIVESTFATDATGSLGSFTYVPFNEGSATLTINTSEMDPLSAVQSRYEAREMVLGPRECSLKFTINLAPTGTAAGSAVAAVSGALGILLKATMGGEHLGTGTTFTGGTAIVPTVTSAAGLVEGGYIGWANSAGVTEWRQIKSISGASVTLAHGFSGAPANADVCYAAATYYFTEDPATSLQFIVSGQNTYDRWLCLGCQAVGGFDIAIDPTGKAIPTVTFNMKGALYYDENQTAGNIGGTISDATYTNYNPIVEYVGDFHMFTVGTPTYTATTSRVHVSAVSWKPKVAFVPVTSPAATAATLGGSPIYRWRGARANPPLEGTFTTYMDSLTWWTNRDAKADMAQQMTIGKSAGSAIVLAAPTVQVLNPQRSASDQEIEGQVVTFKARRNTDTALTTELAKSPVIIALV